MARGDSIFGRADVDWFTGEKTSQLSPTERDFYFNGLWLLAVKIRRSIIPRHLAGGTVVARRLSISRNSAVKHLSKCDSLGLVTINPNGSVTVHSVKELHQRITWKEDPPDIPLKGTLKGHYGDTNDDQLDIDRREEEEESLTDSFIKPSSPVTPTPPDDHPEGVHKSGLSRNSEPTRNPDHINPDSIISDIEIIHSLAYEIIADFNLPPELFSEVSELVSSSPASHIADARAATLDKIHAIAEDKTPDFDKGPLEYFAGILDNRTRKKDSDKP